VRQIADDPNAKFVAGGTNLIALMKMDVERPTKVIDISAVDGHNRMHAILGASDACIAVHPSDMCVAMAMT
jgi:CO/xanthine dehydrogenase FAD-binding subunit